jgi:hypothetical protein
MKNRAVVLNWQTAKVVVKGRGKTVGIPVMTFDHYRKVHYYAGRSSMPPSLLTQLVGHHYCFGITRRRPVISSATVAHHDGASDDRASRADANAGNIMDDDGDLRRYTLSQEQDSIASYSR